MRADQVLAIFEELNEKGRETVDVDLACAGFACWLGNHWDNLSEDDIRTLTSYGAVLWREGFERAKK
jgi:hypothetical protein